MGKARGPDDTGRGNALPFDYGKPECSTNEK
jgi:hypothetical protein